MAGISTAIQITDRVSGVLRNVTSALGATTSAYERLDNAMSGGLNVNTTPAVNAISEVSEALDDAGNGANNAGDNMDRFNGIAQRSGDYVNELTGRVMRLVAAYASMQTVKKAMDMSDELTSTTARINAMNEAFQEADKSAMSTAETMQQIYGAAQDARSEFGAMADVVARFGNNAGDAFSSTKEVIDFANLVQKQMTIAGASTEEASNAILQLSQGLGSGVLRGDELNSIFEQAPNLIRNIAKYLDVPIGKIRDMAKDGQITADIVKNAVFSQANAINDSFNKMPKTWGQLWTSMKNTALMQLQPILEKLNEMANDQAFQEQCSRVMSALTSLATYALQAFQVIMGIADFIVTSWSLIAPYIAAAAAIMLVFKAATVLAAIAQGVETAAIVATTFAQQGLNAAMAACPITWIIAAIIALIAIIYVALQAVAEATGVAESGLGMIVGGVYTCGAVIQNFALLVANLFLGIGNATAALGSNMVIAFSNSVANIKTVFYGLLSVALSVISQIASALSALPFVEFDASGISAAANSYAQKAENAYNSKQSYKNVGDAYKEGASTFAYKNVMDAYDKGVAKGDSAAKKISGAAGKVKNLYNTGKGYSVGKAGVGGASVKSPGGGGGSVPKNVGKIAKNTGDTAKALTTSNEELKYLHDIAERDVINRFTTASITINQNNNNNISGDADLDGIFDTIAIGVQEAIEKTVEGGR